MFLFPVLISVRGREPQGLLQPLELGKLEKVTSSDLEPATFRLAA
jgi:hypothetical protein